MPSIFERVSEIFLQNLESSWFIKHFFNKDQKRKFLNSSQPMVKNNSSEDSDTHAGNSDEIRLSEIYKQKGEIQFSNTTRPRDIYIHLWRAYLTLSDWQKNYIKRHLRPDEDLLLPNEDLLNEFNKIEDIVKKLYWLEGDFEGISKDRFFITPQNILSALDASNLELFTKWLTALKWAKIRVDDPLRRLIENDETLIKLVGKLREDQFPQLRRDNIIAAFMTQDTFHQISLILDESYQPDTNHRDWVSKSRPGFQKHSFFETARQYKRQKNKPEVMDANQEFLQCVVHRNFPKIKEILTNNANALFAIGEVTDDSTRIFQSISAIAYAFWANDGELAQVLISSVLENYDLSRDDKEQFVEFMLEEITRVEREGVYYQLGDESFLEHHHNLPLFLNSLLSYADNAWWNVEQQEIYWRQVIGKQQFLFPRWIVEGYYGRLNYEREGDYCHHYFLNCTQEWRDWWSIVPEETLGIDFAVVNQCTPSANLKFGAELTWDLTIHAERTFAWIEDVLTDHDEIQSLYHTQREKLESVKKTLTTDFDKDEIDDLRPSFCP